MKRPNTDLCSTVDTERVTEDGATEEDDGESVIDRLRHEVVVSKARRRR